MWSVPSVTRVETLARRRFPDGGRSGFAVARKLLDHDVDRVALGHRPPTHNVHLLFNGRVVEAASRYCKAGNLATEPVLEYNEYFLVLTT